MTTWIALGFFVAVALRFEPFLAKKGAGTHGDGPPRARVAARDGGHRPGEHSSGDRPHSLYRVRCVRVRMPGEERSHGGQRKRRADQPARLHWTRSLRCGLSGSGDLTGVRHRQARARAAAGRSRLSNQPARRLHRRRARRDGTDPQCGIPGTTGSRSHRRGRPQSCWRVARCIGRWRGPRRHECDAALDGSGVAGALART